MFWLDLPIVIHQVRKRVIHQLDVIARCSVVTTLSVDKFADFKKARSERRSEFDS